MVISSLHLCFLCMNRLKLGIFGHNDLRYIRKLVMGPTNTPVTCDSLFLGALTVVDWPLEVPSPCVTQPFYVPGRHRVEAIPGAPLMSL